METLLLICGAFALGGILKGATGAGAPIVAVPLLAILYDVPFAVTIFAIPNLLPNIWQGWRYREHQLPPRFTWGYAISGGLGAGAGTVLLANLPTTVLTVSVALVVLVYITFRLLRPGWKLAMATALAVVWPVGFIAGVLQGASGLSAPISLTFLNALRPERKEFIATIAIFFAGLAAVQIPALVLFGLMTWERIWLSTAAVLPLVAFMPVGAFLVRYASKELFDKLILGLLFFLALKLLYDGLF